MVAKTNICPIRSGYSAENLLTVTIKLSVVFSIICLGLSLALSAGAQEASGVYDIYSFGAKGDGKTPDTEALQSAIDQCHAEGGGQVYIHHGQFVSGTLYLKSNVTLYIEAGAVVRASNDLEDFPITPSEHPSYEGTFVTNRALIYAEDVQNVSILGRGTLDGNGDHWTEGPYGSPSFSIRPRIVHLRGCENVMVRGVTFYNSASWGQSYQSCSNLVIDGVTVDSRPNEDIERERFADAKSRNTDGIDLIDCQQVRISNCNINSGDDAICLKSFSPDERCRDITITNCVISSNSSGIKIGTETAGGFEDITIQNCGVYDTRNEAIALLTTDGAYLERINVSNISLRNIKGAAIAIFLGVRNRTYRKDTVVRTPHIRGITIENIRGTRISTDYACSITGLDSIPVEDVLLANIHLQFVGGGEAKDSFRDIPEHETSYPSGRTYGRLPAYGVYIRHSSNIRLANVQLGFEQKDDRPAIIAEDVDQLDLKGVRAEGTLAAPEMIRLVNTREVLISECRPTSPISTFLSLRGDGTQDIYLLNNLLQKSKETVSVDQANKNDLLTEVGTLK